MAVISKEQKFQVWYESLQLPTQSENRINYVPEEVRLDMLLSDLDEVKKESRFNRIWFNKTFTDYYTPSHRDYEIAEYLVKKKWPKEWIEEVIKQKREEENSPKAERGRYIAETVGKAIQTASTSIPDFSRMPQNKQNNFSIRFSSSEILENIQETKWLVQGLLPEASLSFIAGDPKSRKSWLALYIALCVAMSKNVFDRFEVQQAPVLYLQLEDGLGRVGVRYHKLTTWLQEKPKDNFFKLYIGSALKFNQEDTWGTVLEFCAQFKPKLVVVDTLAKAHTAAENDATEMTVVLDRLGQLREKFGATVLIVHHLKKPGQHDRAKRYMAGSRVIEASAESMMFVESDPKTNQSDVTVISKSAEELGFSYRMEDCIVDGKLAIKMICS